MAEDADGMSPPRPPPVSPSGEAADRATGGDARSLGAAPPEVPSIAGMSIDGALPVADVPVLKSGVVVNPSGLPPPGPRLYEGDLY